MTLPSTGEGKARGSRVQGLLGLHSKTLSQKQGFLIWIEGDTEGFIEERGCGFGGKPVLAGHTGIWRQGEHTGSLWLLLWGLPLTNGLTLSSLGPHPGQQRANSLESHHEAGV